jgi:Flp pilus assembly protein TadG
MSFLRCVYRLRHFWRDERANSLMLMGFALPFVIGAAGLGVHTMQLSLVKRQLQREADSAAMAGGYSLFQEQGNTAAIAQANNALTQNDLVPGATATITPGSFTTSTGTTYTSTMYVRLVSNQATPLMALFGRSTSTITAEARAAIVPDGQVCFLALESGTTTGITFAGNSNINLGCGAGTNSISSNAAVNVNGQPSVTASPIVAMGGIPASSAYANGTVLMPNHAELENPFANNSYNPDSSTVSNATCKNGNNWNVIDVGSGTTVDSSSGSPYAPGCYGTINVQGTLTLQPGTYFLANGANNAGLQIGAQGHLTCTGCTFVLTSTTPGNANSFATMNINGGAEVDISASIGGIYDGITIYRDGRASASNQCCTINGNSSSSFSGAFYFPNDTLTFNGTSGMTLNCFQMVALRLAFSGNAAITNTCTDKPGDEDAWQLDSVRLIS